MKVTLSENVVPEEIDAEFVGLCVDFEGDIWIFGNEFAVIVTTTANAQFVSMPKKEAIETVGSFTKYNGSITLEND